MWKAVTFLNGNPRVKLPADHEAALILKEENKAKNLVLTLSEPYLDAGRNITVDRFFVLKNWLKNFYEDARRWWARWLQISGTFRLV